MFAMFTGQWTTLTQPTSCRRNDPGPVSVRAGPKISAAVCRKRILKFQRVDCEYGMRSSPCDELCGCKDLYRIGIACDYLVSN